ncbi:MAG: SAM-dependent methyltransferase [Proteobacteria bacterium]|nr:SAM-dependent methyltransferase [Pseudomonadota bacterium]
MKDNKYLYLLIVFFAAIMAALASPALALSIGGAVRQPLNLTNEDLLNAGQAEARLSEVTRDGKFKGVFVFRGVPLRNLLQMATIQKEVEGYSKPIDLAIVVTDKNGKRAVLSWGEVFYGKPSDIIVALSASPVMPGAPKSCSECHPSSIYKPAMDQLSRKIVFPKLVIADDLYTERCLEDIAHIEVVDLKGKAQWKPDSKTASPTFTIKDNSGKTLEIGDLSGYRTARISLKQVGSGRGYHGLKNFEGVPIREILRKVDADNDPETVFLFTSVDGYRSLLSFGEIFMGAKSDRIIMCNKNESSSTVKGKGFSLVVPDDFLADRMVQTVKTIEIISLKATPKVLVIGVGCGDTSLITLEAISQMGKAGAFVGGKFITERFSKYMGGKPILFDPFTSFEPVYKKAHPGLSDEEVKKRTTELRAAEIKSIWDTLKAGESVAILEPGDPTIYGGWENWLLPEFTGKIEVVTGINSFSAANAMMGKNIASDKKSIVLTTPWALKGNEGTLKTVSETGDTMVIFMGLKEVKDLASLLGKYYPPTTVVTIVYKAGISHEKRLIKTRLADLVSAVAREGENFLGLIYIGGI